MADKVSIEDQIKCVEREIGMRRKVYGNRVEKQKMTAEFASEQIGAMEAVLATLQGIKAAADEHRQPTLGFG